MFPRDKGGRRRRGNALVEFCFLMPWYVFLFVGTFDFGFYAYSLISTANAARVSAYFCSFQASHCNSAGSGNALARYNTACTSYTIGQLKFLPNVGSGVSSCSSSPVTLTVTYYAAGTSCAISTDTCVKATVAYVTPRLIPIPGLIPGQITITKAVMMRLRT